jgi:hypothetical protein
MSAPPPTALSGKMLVEEINQHALSLKMLTGEMRGGGS